MGLIAISWSAGGRRLFTFVAQGPLDEILPGTAIDENIMTYPNDPNSGSDGNWSNQAPPMTPDQARARAKAEKVYRKATRPFYKKKRVILPVAAVVLLIIIISVSAGNGGSPVTAKGCAASYPDKQASDVCADGNGTVTLSNGLAVTAKPFTLVNDEIGGKSLCSDVTIVNISNKSQDYNVFDFKVQTPSGDVGSTSAQSFAGTLDSGTLVTGGRKAGKVCSNNTGAKGQYVFIYKPNAFESDRGIWLFTV
ncbi:MAG: hypothetical protein WAN20_14260 [Pseudonocardiaceae bacterium]